MLKHLNGLLCLQFKWNEWLLDYDKTKLRKKCPYSELLWSAFSCIRAEYGEIRSISPYSVQMPENADQYNSEYRHFLRSISPCSVQTRENADQNNSEHGHFLRRSLRIQSKCGEMRTMRTNFTQCGIVVLKVFYHCQISPFFSLCMLDAHQRFSSSC